MSSERQKDWRDDNEEFAPRPGNAKDLLELKRVTKLGKLACWIGIGISVLGGVISIAGLMKDTGVTKFKNWFGASIGLWILILVAQAVCTWEVSDRLGRHNEKLVKGCKWFYLAVVAFSIGLLLLLLSIWVFNGSFVDTKSSQTSNWVLLVIDLILLVFGTNTSLVVYFQYAKQIKNTDSHTARPKEPLTRTVSKKASEAREQIKRTMSNRSKSSQRSKKSQQLAYSPPNSNSEDSLPEFPVYDRKKSVKAGEIVSRPVSTVTSRRDSTQTRSSTDDYFDEQGPPYPNSKSPSTSRTNSRTSTTRAVDSVPKSLQIVRPKPDSPKSIPYVRRPASPDYSSGSDSDSRPDSSFLPSNTKPSRQTLSKKPFRSTIPDKDELFLDSPRELPSIPRKPVPWMNDRDSLPSQRPSSLNSPIQYRAYSPPTASSPPSSSPLLQRSTSPSPSQYRAYSPPSSSPPTRTSTVSSVQSRYSTSASTIQGGGGSISRTSSMSSTTSVPYPSTYGNQSGRNTRTKPNPFSSDDSDTDDSIAESYLKRTNSLGSLRIANP